MIVRVVPIQGVAIQCRLRIAKQGHQTESIHVPVVFGVSVGLCHVEQCRIEVDGHHGLVTRGSCSGYSRPPHQQRHPYSTLEIGALAIPQGDVRGGLITRLGNESAVVTREYDQRVLRDSQIGQFA